MIESSLIEQPPIALENVPIVAPAQTENNGKESSIEPPEFGLGSIAESALTELQTTHQKIDKKVPKLLHYFFAIRPLEKLVAGIKSHPELQKVTAAQFLTSPEYGIARKKLSPEATLGFRSALQRLTDSYESLNQRKLLTQLGEETMDHYDSQGKQFEAEQAAIIDSLTGIENRRSFNFRFSNMLMQILSEYRHFEEFPDSKAERRTPQRITVIMADIDHFKQFNDTYGHLEGDIALRETAQRLYHAFRPPDDIIARYGGEEYCIVIAENGEIRAESLHKKIDSRRKEISETEINGKKVTLSMGAATFSPQGLEMMFTKATGEARSELTRDNIQLLINKLLEEADYELYRAKKAGRNRMATYDRMYE
jgi:diguanylate cyclase (GGDEF)-like protein